VLSVIADINGKDLYIHEVFRVGLNPLFFLDSFSPPIPQFVPELFIIFFFLSLEQLDL
jgi:hypothetical protein